MKRTTLLLLALILTAGVARADQVFDVFTASGANGSGTGPIDTSNARTAIVYIEAATGTPDGTVNVYVDGVLIPTAAYATPTVRKAFRGPVGGSLVVTLSGNTPANGTVNVTVRLKP